MDQSKIWPGGRIPSCETSDTLHPLPPSPARIEFGIGLDLVLEGGGYQGYWIGGLQLVASPEFHF